MRIRCFSVTDFLKICLCLLVSHVLSLNLTDINIPEAHLPYYFNAFPQIAKECAEDENCAYKQYLDTDKCWGYEPDCKPLNAYSMPYCPGDHKGWVKTKKAQVETFYSQGDFGNHFHFYKIILGFD